MLFTEELIQEISAREDTKEILENPKKFLET
jgi:hypothetical protein